MCQANTSLFYGLSVTGWTLSRAAKAHPLLALRIVDRRLGLGTLQTSTGLGAQKVPREIWEIVRTELCASALEEAESTWVESLRCRWCRLQMGTSWGWPGDCDSCSDRFLDVLCETGFGADVCSCPPRLGRQHRYLTPFRLSG